MSDISPRNGRVFYRWTDVFPVTAARFCWCVLHHPWVLHRRRHSLHPWLNSFRRYAALSRPYRAPILLLLSVGCALFECLPTATKSHALRAEMPLRGSSEAAGWTPRGTSEAAGGTPRGTSEAAGGTHRGTPSAAGGDAARHTRGRRRDAPRHFRGRRRDAGRHIRGRRRDAGRHVCDYGLRYTSLPRATTSASSMRTHHNAAALFPQLFETAISFVVAL